MRLRTILSLLWCSCCLMVPVGTLYSQTKSTGTLAGTVLDASNKQPLPAATVLVVGTNNGTVTDLQGRFVLNELEAGRQKIKVAYVGYKSKELQVEIKPGAVTKIEVSLEETAITGKEVVVTAQRQGQEQTIAQELSSNTIVNMVAPDRIRENPDANAAEAVGRLPGISLVRSGGVGENIIIRGMNPSYTVVELNGIQIPSNSVDTRGVNISGLSMYSLDGISVFKSITPDMEANAVAGAVNLKLAHAPDQPALNIIAEPGYNHQNNYWGNYTVNLDASNRFFNDKLGVRVDLDAEGANRGAQTLGGSYAVNSNIHGGIGFEPVDLTNVSLNNIARFNEKQAASLVLDYRFSRLSTLSFYNFFSASGSRTQTFTKEYQPAYYNFYDATLDDNGKSLLYNGSLQGKSDIGNLDLEYGAAFSQTHNYDPYVKNWQFRWMTVPYAPAMTTDSMLAVLPVNDFINANLDTGSTTILQSIALIHMGYNSTDVMQKNGQGYLNVKLSFNLTQDISGYLKAGGEYKSTRRVVSYYAADQPFTAYGYAQSQFPWLTVSTITPQPSGYSFASGSVNSFLNGKYDFGWNMDFTRLNDYWNWWNAFSEKVIQEDSVIQKVGSNLNIGFVPDFYYSSIHDQSITDNYYAAYLMADLKLGQVVSFVPGVRYEKEAEDLLGHQVYNMAVNYNLTFPSTPVKATPSNEFFLPNFHLKVKPLDWLAIQAAYTKTLGRPDYQEVVPNVYISNNEEPFTYRLGNPDLQPEQWSNFDLQAAVFGNMVGLFSVDGFYKVVKNKIWTRTYTRVPGDPVIAGFKSTDLVSVTETVNHSNPVYVQGAEFDLQTNFWYLPEPLSYFTLYLNYTVMTSHTLYPAQRLYTVVTIDSATGRPNPPKSVRVDSSITGRMLDQPNSIANVSLGFEYSGFNIWLSYQYNGNILTSWSNQQELSGRQSSYQSWDLQATYQLPVRGLKLRCDLANFNDAQQVSTLVSGPRPTYIESYGWTSDFGFMYNF